MKQSLGTWNSKNDLIYDYLKEIIFDNEFKFLEDEYDARLWLRELFISAQTHSFHMRIPHHLVLSFMVAILPLCLSMVHVETHERPQYFWMFRTTSIFISATYLFPNIIFLYAAFNDANRRNSQMTSLSNCLEIDFHKKDSVSIRLPTINFFDPQSLQSWLEARKIVLDIGQRFQIRMMWYVSLFIILAAIMLTFIFAAEMGFIDKDLLNTEQWILFWVYAAILTLSCFIILLPYSYINKQTQYQMKRLIFVREVYQRIVRD